MWLGGAWVDLVALERVDFEESPVSITRGRANEYSQMDPGQCTFTLVNDDGAFTPGLPTSIYRDSLTLHRPVRVLVQMPDESWSTRFTGFVDDETVALGDETGATSRVTVTAVDALALMGLKTLLSQLGERIRALSPTVYYPLEEDSSALKALDRQGRGPALNPTTFGTTEGGTLEFGAQGGPVSGEGAGVVNITRASTVDGVYLLSAAALPALGTSFTVVSIQNPTTSGTVWQLTQGSLALSLYYDASARKYKVRQYNGSANATLATTSATVAGMHVEAVTISATQAVLRSDATRTAGTRAAGTFTGPTLRVGRGANTGSGYNNMMSGIVAGVAIIPGDVMADMDALATAIVSPPAIATDDFMRQILDWAGMPQAVGWLGDHPSLGYVFTGGGSPQAIGQTIGQGANGRYACLRDGSLSWVDGSYVPTLVELGGDAVDPGLRWARDRSAYVTEVTTSLPSGGSYTYTAPSPELVSESRSITGVLSSDQACKDAAAFIVSGSSLAPRLSSVTIDLLTQPDDAIVTDVLGLDIGSLVALVDLPPQIPSDQVLVVEGMAEAIGGTVWTVTLNTSPFTRSLPPDGWYFAFVDSDTTFIDDGLAYIANL